MDNESNRLTPHEVDLVREMQAIEADPYHGPTRLFFLALNDPDTFAAVLRKLNSAYTDAIRQIEEARQ